MKVFYFHLTIISLLIFSSCKNDNTNAEKAKIDPFEAATPHGKALPQSELSEIDKNKLAEAKGKSAFKISKNEVDSLFRYSNDQLHIYSFFSLDHPDCSQVNSALLELQKEWGDTTFQVIFFSIDTDKKLRAINSSIREQGVTSDVFVTSDSLDVNWFNQINPNWTGEVPAIYLVNQSEGTDIFYQKVFSKEELSAIIQPFIL